MFKGSTQTEDGRSDVSRWHRVTKVVFWLMIHAALVRCHPSRIACSSPHKSPTSFPKRGLDMAGRTRGERASERPKPLLLIPAFNFLKDKYFDQVDCEHRFAAPSTFNYKTRYIQMNMAQRWQPRCGWMKSESRFFQHPNHKLDCLYLSPRRTWKIRLCGVRTSASETVIRSFQLKSPFGTILQIMLRMHLVNMRHQIVSSWLTYSSLAFWN